MYPSQYKSTLARVFADACAELSSAAVSPIETPREKMRGDFACAAALQLARILKRPPPDIAAAILSRAALPDFVEEAKIEGGYINIKIKAISKLAIVDEVLSRGGDFGRGEDKNESVLLEFVSANPTGPLHVGHGRAAAYGDSLANILQFAGCKVMREYYVNDAGRQAEILAASVWLRRLLRERGRGEEIPAGAYRGDYLADVESETRVLPPPESPPDVDRILADMRANSADRAGDILAAAMGESFPESARTAFVRAVSDHVLAIIKTDLRLLGVRDFDNWFSEQSMHDKGLPDLAIDKIREHSPDALYEKDGALWFRATARGDSKDRVLRRADGRRTYFAADIAYHRDKFSRGMSRLINVLGADHHGYVPRLKAAVDALGCDSEKMETVLIQFVALVNQGQRMKMSTRAGEFVRLSELIKAIGKTEAEGKDAARFFYVSRKNDQHLDFDLRLAAERSRKNPVFYLQYAYARAASILRSWGGDVGALCGADLAALTQNPAAAALCARLAEFPVVISQAADDRAVHSLATFLQELAAAMHHYYEQTRILGETPDAGMRGRLALLAAAQTVLRNGLTLLGISVRESM